MICAKCGAQLADGAKFCSRCGAAQSTRCPNCGNPLPSSAKFCSTCGLPNGAHGGGQGQRPSGAPFVDQAVLTIMEGSKELASLKLSRARKTRLSFGSAPDNDIIIKPSSGIVAPHHGFLELRNDGCHLVDAGSELGIMLAGERQSDILLTPDVVAAIGPVGDVRYAPILLMLSYGRATWRTFKLANRSRVSIGRADDNELVLNSPAVSRHHAVLNKDMRTRTWTLADSDSYNGVFLNGKRVQHPTKVGPGDFFYIANRLLVFMHDGILYRGSGQGVDVVARGLVQVRKNGKRRRVTTDHVSLHITPGQFVAIVGGSGAGKSTLLNELNGTDPATEGSVSINGIDLYSNYDVLKNSIGYVPQQDIVYDNLTLTDMLRYAAELRMPPDTSAEERATRADEVIHMLELDGERDNMIHSLSGGQKKRASIAVELLADPRLIFLDEPTSGLDPGIEQSMMEKLAGMANEGRTIILVTHTTHNLGLCDQIVFLGPGGKLCFDGGYEEACAFFDVGTDGFERIYNLVNKSPDEWAQRFKARYGEFGAGQPAPPPQQAAQVSETERPSFISQVSTLSRRYLRLILNDRQRLFLLLAQAPILSLLICSVAGKDCFMQYEGTKSCLFALSCAAFWVGMLNAIQEICKERVILVREYSGGLRLSAYLASKVIVLGTMCVIQSLLLVVVFCLFEDVPKDGLTQPALELYVTTLLITFSATCMGLAISALFSNPDRAIAVAPLLIMPQILFSGLVFKLEGMSESISTFVNCRWGMEAYGTTANLNALDYKLYGKKLEVSDELSMALGGKDLTIDADTYPHEFEAAFDYTVGHLMSSWGILVLFCVVCLGICGGVLHLKMRNHR